MKGKKIIVLINVLILLTAFFVAITFAGCKNEVKGNNSLLSASRADSQSGNIENLYKKFLAGEISAFDENGTPKTVNKYILYDELTEDAQYAFFDVDKNGVAELCVSCFGLYFFTVKNGEVYHWYDTSSYSRLLNNGAILYERHGAAPTHINYEYCELDENAKEKSSVDFSWWDGKSVKEGEIHPDTYFVGGKEVSKEEYDKTARRYLKIGSDEIVWHKCK